jgi:D-alanyl-D-alanine carboxypeptidase/D-alanyl-D-alanine-endopeptidase (penicillin-binding protein 4)
MPRVVHAALVLSIVLCGVISTAAAGLRDDVDRLVRNAPLKGATVSVSIRDASSNSVLVAINADAALAPASNMKLLTTGAALHALGPDFEFTTRLKRDGDRIIVVGDGDPALGDPDLLKITTVNGQEGVDVETLLGVWIKPIAESGLTSVSEVIVDDRILDREFVNAGWPSDQLSARYCAQVAGLNFHMNVLHFYPRPRQGQAPIIGDSVPDAPWVRITNLATSRTGGRDESNVWIARLQNTNDFTFRGNVRFAYKAPVPITINNPPDFFAHLLADRLTRHSVTVGKARIASADDVFAKAQQIGPVIATPISTVIARCNRDSENLYAEALLKRIGAALTGEPGSWTNGAAIMRHIIHERLNDPALCTRVVISDGSGLSSANRVAASTMTAWLGSFHNDEKLGPAFIDSLAVGGKSGTLDNRFKTGDLRGATVQAKSGYINGVSCLSGFVTASDGRRRSFSILMNGVKEVGHAKKVQEQIVLAIAHDLADAPVQLGSD